MTDFLIELSDCAIDLRRKTILRQGRSIAVEPRTWRVLELLARFRHRVVTKDELLQALRPDGRASEGALKQAIRLARLAIGDSGAGAVIRSVPRVGYLFDPGPVKGIGHLGEAPTGHAPLRIFVTPLQDQTGRPSLRWAAIGLMSCLSHGLAADRRLLLMREPQSLGLEMVRPKSPHEFKQALRATGADWVLSGTLTSRERSLHLEIQMRSADRHQVVSVSGSTAAELIAPAIEDVHRQILTALAADAFDGGMRQCSFLSIETFARAMHAAAQNRDAAALRMLQLLAQFEPKFPGLELELLRAQAACASSEGDETARRLLALAKDNNDTVMAAQTFLCAGRLCATGGRFREAAQHFHDALRVGGSTMAADWVGHTLTLLASTLCHLGEMDAVEGHLSHAQSICAATGNRYLSLNILWLRAAMSSQTGNLERSVPWHKRLAAAARRLRASLALTAACINLAGDHIQLYKLDEACRYAEEATAAALTMENGVYLAMAANVHCLLLRLQNRPEAAAALLSQLPQPHPVDDEGQLWQAHGHAAAAAGRLDHAADCFTTAAQAYRRRKNCLGEVHLVPWLIEALVRSGRLEQAEAELKLASDQAHLQDDWTMAHLLYARALLAKARHQHAECSELLTRLQESTSAKPLFRELGRRLARAPQPTPSDASSVGGRQNFLRQEYRVGDCLVDIDRRVLWVNGRRRRLAPMPFDVLAYLCRNSTRVVSQSELLSALWPNESGSLESVAQAVASIRRAARLDAPSRELVETVYGRGYRLMTHPSATPVHEDEVASSLITLVSAPELPALVVIPANCTSGTAAFDASPVDQLLVLGHSISIHAHMNLLSPDQVRDALSAREPANAEELATALRNHYPSACVVQARLTCHDECVRLEYDALDADFHISGTLHHRSVTALGRALALHLLHEFGPTDAASHGVPQSDPWLLQWLDRAALAIEQHNWRRALNILDVVTEEEPRNQHAAALRELAVNAIQGSAKRASPRQRHTT
jgi:DNA-binding winged helix-turn-helix (wHTH) protein